MTDSFNALIVVLEGNFREEDAQPLIDTIEQMRGVLRVQPNIVNPADVIAEERARQGLATKLWEFLYPQERK